MPLLDILLSGKPNSIQKNPEKTPQSAPASQKRVDAVEPLSSGEFSFFETLADTDLSKYAGLKGTIVHESRGSTQKPEPVVAERRKQAESPVARQINPADVSDEAESIPPSDLTKPASVHDGMAGDGGNSRITVQVSTFTEFDHAINVLKRLRVKGYPAFMKAEEASLHGGEVWYRVYLGRYPDHEKAMAAIYRARAEERLNPLIVFEKD